MTRTLLSPTVGVPIAILAMALWLVVELYNIRGRKRPALARVSAVLVTVVLLGLIAARFAKYS